MYQTVRRLLMRAWILAVAVALMLMPVPVTAGGPPADDAARVIVELEGPAAFAATSQRERAADIAARRAAQQDRVVDRARDRGVRVDRTTSYTAVFNGFSTTVSSSDTATLEQLPGVAAVHPDREFEVSLDDTVAHVGAPDAWERTGPSGRPLTGEGVTVAVLDTGLDYTHPSLGGGLGPDHKVVGGHDFVDGDTDPMDEHGHGTHVAGIVAGEGEVTGVAPGASLVAYRVLNQFGVGWESDIIAALDRAVSPTASHPADVINLSLGGPGGPDGPVARAAARAVDAGAAVIAAAGNEGPTPSTIGSPAVAPEVVAVAASAAGVQVPDVNLVAPVDRDWQPARLAMSGPPPNSPVERELVSMAYGEPADYDGVDVDGKAVHLWARFPWEIPDQVQRAVDHGAAAVIMGSKPYSEGAAGPWVDKGHDFATSGTESPDVPVVGIRQDESAEIAALEREGEDLSVEVSGVDITDEMAAFSSRGPTGTFALKPDLTAPGVAVRSTLPDGEFAELSGTSMAAPHVAGAAAIVHQGRPELRASDVAAVLTAATTGLDAAATEQGAGLLQVADALDSSIVAGPRAVSFGIADSSAPRVEANATLDLRSLADEDVTVELGASAHGGPNRSLELPDVVEVPAGESTEIPLRLSLERPAEDVDVQGWIVGRVSDGTTVRVPYLLSVRHLQLHVTPDPTAGETEAFVYSPAVLSEAPTLELTGPAGETRRVATDNHHDRWYRADLDVAGHVGVWSVRAAGLLASGRGSLRGTTAFEVVDGNVPLRGDSTWRPIGPNGAAGHVAVSPASPATLAVADPTETGLHTTRDAGDRWREIRSMPAVGGGTAAVEWLSVDSLVAAVRGGLHSPFEGRVLQSDDRGATWSILDYPDIRVNDVDVHGKQAVVLAEDRLSVRRGDETWRHLGGDFDRTWDVTVAGDVAYAGTNDGVYAVDLSSEKPSLERIHRPDGLPWMTGVWVSGELVVANAYFDGLSVSRDGGASWEPSLDPDSFRDRIKVAGIVGDEIWALSTETLYRSRDEGRSWEASPPPIDDGIPSQIVDPGRGRTTYVAYENVGVFATQNGSEWSRVGTPGTDIRDLAVVDGPRGGQLLAGTTVGLHGRSLEENRVHGSGVTEWGRVDGEGYIGVTREHVAAAPSEPQRVYSIRQSAIGTFHVSRSDDGGTTWQEVHTDYETATALAIDPSDPDTVYVGYWRLSGQGLLITRDGGATWRKVPLDGAPRGLAVAPETSERVWVAGDDGLHRSDDGGITFDQLAEHPVTAVSVDPTDPDRLVVGGDSLWMSRDGGETLTEGSRSDLPLRVSDLVRMPGDPSVVFATSDEYSEAGLARRGRGVYATRDGGQSWSSLSLGLGSLSATSVAVSPDGRALYVGTRDGGVHRLSLDAGNP